MEGADVLVSGRCPPPWPPPATRLRLVHAAGAGTDNIGIAALPPGTQMANTFHHEDAIAEYAGSAPRSCMRRGFLRQHTALRHEAHSDTPLP